MQLHELSAELARRTEALKIADGARRQAEADAARALEAMHAEERVTAALRHHNDALRSERGAMGADLERSNGDVRALTRDCQYLHGRWSQSAAEAHVWADEASASKAEARLARASAGEARNAATAVQRTLVNASEYKMAEEAGYAMQTIIQLAPSKPTISSVWNQPTEAEAWVAA